MKINADALDRWITGNFGDDRIPDPVGTCPKCSGAAYDIEDGDAECEDCGNIFSPMTAEDWEYERADRERDRLLIEGE